jgi:hypothetical protein
MKPKALVFQIIAMRILIVIGCIIASPILLAMAIVCFPDLLQYRMRIIKDYLESNNLNLWDSIKDINRVEKNKVIKEVL